MVNVNLVLSQAQLALIAHALRSIQPHNIPTHILELYKESIDQNRTHGTVQQVVQKDRDFLIEQLGLLAVTAPEGTHAMVL